MQDFATTPIRYCSGSSASALLPLHSWEEKESRRCQRVQGSLHMRTIILKRAERKWGWPWMSPRSRRSGDKMKASGSGGMGKSPQRWKGGVGGCIRRGRWWPRMHGGWWESLVRMRGGLGANKHCHITIVTAGLFNRFNRKIPEHDPQPAWPDFSSPASLLLFKSWLDASLVFNLHCSSVSVKELWAKNNNKIILKSKTALFGVSLALWEIICFPLKNVILMSVSGF